MSSLMQADLCPLIGCHLHYFIMAALRSTCGHYIFALWFLSSSIFVFFPRLISVVRDWMSTILPDMVWP